MTIFYAIILLGILIFVHELGHFLFAKMVNVKVLRFSLGFGPRVLGKKYGETEYQISAIPLGGYVKMLGEEPGDEISDEDRAR
ncbi:MAG TPA: site-2 protease family protein, partial [Thermodesulfovibrionales bacterium]|nr:site-2 protease family protein [Thermodesulfovibrionales bacterium]